MSIGDVLNLTWGDIRREYNKKTSPLCFEITRQKTDVLFMTFIGDWGRSMLRVHLSKAGKKQDSDPIYTMTEIREFFDALLKAIEVERYQ
jgi:hypothetical protein